MLLSSFISVAVAATGLFSGVTAQAFGPSYKCLVSSYCQDHTDSFDDGVTATFLYNYGAINYTGFNVGYPFLTGPKVQPVTTGKLSAFIRGAGRIGAPTLPTMGVGTLKTPRFFIKSFYFACGKPGTPFPKATQEGVPCFVKMQAYTQVLNLLPIGTPTLFTVPFVPTIVNNATQMKFQQANLLQTPVAAAYKIVTFDARGLDGQPVDFYIDEMKYTAVSETIL